MRSADPSGYSSRFLAWGYRRASPLYDLLVWWGFLPLGGERKCRRDFVDWLDLEPGLSVASLCCGTGAMERAIGDGTPGLSITGVDLGPGQIARARKKLCDQDVTYLLGDAARTGLPGGRYDRVLIALALHEMHRPARLAVLREAYRLCAPEGFVLAIEHGRPTRWLSRWLRALWWFFWIPGNPEGATSRDLRRRGLDREMRESGLEVIGRYTTMPEWIEAFLARPKRP